jgi:MSHA biogenesis protein MshJ
LQAQITALLQGHRIDPNVAARARLQALKGELAGLDREIAGEERKFTSPSQMRGVIEGMLARNRGVKLVDLKTLPVSSIEDQRAGAAEKAPAKPVPGRLVYRHGMELTVAGGYLDLLAYVADLERLPTQLYWGALDMDASAYPRLAMKLTVYTLSLERAWMNV